MYDNVIRRDVDVRVKSVHLNCKGFKSAIDSSADAFKKFHSLMNQRNDFLHGNIDPHQLKYDTVHFDGTIPLFHHYRNMSELALVNSLIHVEPQAALRDIETVRAFIDLVLGHLQEDIRRSVEMFMQSPNPGWCRETKRPGILFPPHIVHSVVGPASGGKQASG